MMIHSTHPFTDASDGLKLSTRWRRLNNILTATQHGVAQIRFHLHEHVMTASAHQRSNSLPCGWLTNVVTQKLGIFAMSSDRFLKYGWRNLLYCCSTFKISSLACSFSLQRKKRKRWQKHSLCADSHTHPQAQFILTCQFHSVLRQFVQLLLAALFLQRKHMGWEFKAKETPLQAAKQRQLWEFKEILKLQLILHFTVKH